MIKIISILTILLSSLFSYNDIFDKGLDFREGVINYSVSGSEHGSITIYSKDYGKSLVIYSRLNKNFINKKRETLKYITNKWIYELNLQTKVGIKYYNLNYLEDIKFQNLSYTQQDTFSKNYKTSIKDIQKTSHGYDLISSIVDGKYLEKAKQYDLVFQKEVNLFGFHSKTELLQIDKITIDSDIFNLPNDIKFTIDNKKNKTLSSKANYFIKSFL